MFCVEEVGDEDMGFTWNILRIDGQEATTVASCFDRPFAERVLSALEWQESMREARLSLGLDRVQAKPKAKPKAKPLTIQVTRSKK